MDLKWLLVRRITVVALACLLAGSALAIYLTAREAQRHNVELADMVGRQLDLQLSRIGRSTDVPARFPDWDIVAGLSLQPGQCIELRGVDGARETVPGADEIAGEGRFPSQVELGGGGGHRALVGGGHRGRGNRTRRALPGRRCAGRGSHGEDREAPPRDPTIGSHAGRVDPALSGLQSLFRTVWREVDRGGCGHGPSTL